MQKDIINAKKIAEEESDIHKGSVQKTKKNDIISIYLNKNYLML